MSALRPQHPYQNPNIRVASYESILDLFTLLSFILIVASFILVAQTNRQNSTSTPVTSQLLSSGAGVTPSEPPEIMLLIFAVENSQSKLVILDPNSGTRIPFIVSTNDIEIKLDQISSMLTGAPRVQFDIPTEKSRRDGAVILQAEQWLTEKRLTNWSIAFY